MSVKNKTFRFETVVLIIVSIKKRFQCFANESGNRPSSTEYVPTYKNLVKHLAGDILANASSQVTHDMAPNLTHG